MMVITERENKKLSATFAYTENIFKYFTKLVDYLGRISKRYFEK